MLETVLIILIAGAVAILAAMRFITAVRKLASREPDTHTTTGHLHNSMGLTPLNQGNNTRTLAGHLHNSMGLTPLNQGHNTRNTHASSGHYGTRRQDKPPLVFWAVASPLIAAASLTVILLLL
ncbi:MAG: hypothetical protein U9Q76_09540 [candidate division WOR-3 bacterium]|nr:hypothetical protein [candidate division WOR-3 bacterium]